MYGLYIINIFLQVWMTKVQLLYSECYIIFSNKILNSLKTFTALHRVEQVKNTIRGLHSGPKVTKNELNVLEKCIEAKDNY